MKRKFTSVLIGIALILFCSSVFADTGMSETGLSTQNTKGEEQEIFIPKGSFINLKFPSTQPPSRYVVQNMGPGWLIITLRTPGGTSVVSVKPGDSSVVDIPPGSQVTLSALYDDVNASSLQLY